MSPLFRTTRGKDFTKELVTTFKFLHTHSILLVEDVRLHILMFKILHNTQISTCCHHFWAIQTCFRSRNMLWSTSLRMDSMNSETGLIRQQNAVTKERYLESRSSKVVWMGRVHQRFFFFFLSRTGLLQSLASPAGYNHVNIEGNCV